jgi:hypothetical protein
MKQKSDVVQDQIASARKIIEDYQGRQGAGVARIIVESKFVRTRTDKSFVEKLPTEKAEMDNYLDTLPITGQERKTLRQSLLDCKKLWDEREEAQSKSEEEKISDKVTDYRDLAQWLRGDNTSAFKAVLLERKVKNNPTPKEPSDMVNYDQPQFRQSGNSLSSFVAYRIEVGEGGFSTKEAYEEYKTYCKEYGEEGPTLQLTTFTKRLPPAMKERFGNGAEKGVVRSDGIQKRGFPGFCLVHKPILNKLPVATHASHAKSVKNSGAVLCKVKLSRLTVDAQYQRRLDSKHASKLSLAFNSRYCEPLTCSLRPDGTMVVVEGQHRLKALIANDFKSWNVSVHMGLSIQQEAAMFYSLNSHPKGLNGWDKFRAAYKSGSSAHVEMIRIAKDAGLTNPISDPGGSKDNWDIPSSTILTCCFPGLGWRKGTEEVDLYNRYLCETLCSILKRVWYKKKGGLMQGAQNVSLVRGLAAFLRVRLLDRKGCDPEIFAERLITKIAELYPDPSDLTKKALKVAADTRTVRACMSQFNQVLKSEITVNFRD